MTGLLNRSDAARFLGIPRQTFSRWARGYRSGEPLLHVLPTGAQRTATVPFVAMAEAHVLTALRAAGVVPHRIWPALKRLQEEFGTEYALLSPNLVSDGIDVLWDFSRTRAGVGLIEQATDRQAIREIVTDYLQYVILDQDGFPAALRLHRFLPAEVVIDPHMLFGQPYFVGTRTRVADAAAMLKAGEDAAVIADELGIGVRDVRIAARVLLGRAA